MKGFELPEKESTNDCSDIIKEYIKDKLKLKIDDHEYDRIHRIGKIKNINGINFQAIIVKFKGFKERTNVYRARSKRKDSKIKISLDLTQRRAALLHDAYVKTESDPKVKFVFADINCSLCLHTNDNKWRFFNSDKELDKILDELHD